jgi:twitching motility protein PilU
MNLAAILKIMVNKEASDVFVTVGVPPCIKVHGEMLPLSNEILNTEQVEALVYSCMSEAQQRQFEQDHECNIALSQGGVGRFRVSAFIQRGTPGMVLRRINTEIPEIDELNLPDQIRDLAMLKRGLILLVGGTGSGKSTSLASMIGHRNRFSTGHIITIEDPIEFVHPHAGCIVTQREVGIDTESFEVALRNTLRQAPDVILIGEVRSRETMEYAIAFAETGHLCMATLHANNANQALDRIINFFPEERRPQLLLDLSLNMKAIIAQQLLRTVDGQGRRVAVEIMLNSPLIADLIRKGEVHKIKEVMKRSTNEGMQTFDLALFDLFRSGAISIDQALAHADSVNELRLMIKNFQQSHGARPLDSTSGLSLAPNR